MGDKLKCFHVAVTGVKGVGKTTLISQCHQENCPDEDDASLHPKLHMTVEVDSIKMNIQFAENPLGLFSYDALMVLFDTRSRPTFTAVQQSKDSLAAFPGPIALVGTDMDVDPMKVSYEEGLEFAKTIGAGYFHLSIQNPQKVRDLCQTLFRQLITESPVTTQLIGQIEFPVTTQPRNLLTRVWTFLVACGGRRNRRV